MRALNWKWAGWMGMSLVLSIGMMKADTPSLLDTPGSTAAAAAGPANGGDIGFDFTKVEMVDASLKPKLSLLRVGASRGTNNLLAVFAGVENATGHTLTFEVETLYKDKDGNPINHGSWIRLSLKPHEETDYKSSALSDDAVDFTIRMRRPPTATASAHE